MVDGNGLENRRAGNGTVGSNPTPSASSFNDFNIRKLLFAISFSLRIEPRLPAAKQLRLVCQLG